MPSSGALVARGTQIFPSTVCKEELSQPAEYVRGRLRVCLEGEHYLLYASLYPLQDPLTVCRCRPGMVFTSTAGVTSIRAQMAQSAFHSPS